MSALLNQTSVASGEFLFGQGGGSPNLDLSTLTLVAGTTSTIVETYPGAGRIQTLDSGTVVADITLDSVKGGIVFADAGGNEYVMASNVFDCNNISTSVVDIDGQTLTATPTELLLNGIPLATTSNISSLSDWSLDPAISTLNMNGNPIIGIGGGVVFNTNTATAIMSLSDTQSSFRIYYEQPNIFQSQIQMGKSGIAFSDSSVGGVDMLLNSNALTVYGSVSTPAIFAGSGVFNDISTQTLTAFSTIHNISTLSSLVLEAQEAKISSLTAGFISTPALVVSSINGAEFTSTQITVQVAGVSSLVANSISSIGAELRTALVSTLQFNPSFNPSLDVNLGLGSLFGNLAGAAAGGIGVLVGGAGLGTGIAALAQGRQTNNINSNSYELINGTTQLQISTLGTPFSTVYRFVSSVAENVPGQEYFISTIHSPGVAIRSLSDPLNTVSTPNSTIQSFGQWVALDANLPIPSTVSTFNQLYTSSLQVSTVNMNNGTLFRRGLPFGGGAGGVSTTELFWSDASPPLDANLRIGQLVLSGDDVGGLNYSKDVLITNQNSGNRLQVYGAGGVGPSTIAFLSDIPAVVSSFNFLQTSTLVFNGISTVSLSTSGTAGAQGQPAGRLVMGGCDMDFGQNDIWCQQIRLGAGNPTNAQTEIVFYDANANVRGLNTALQDRTIRVISTVNSGTGGYLLDTAINPPFFSTIGGNVNLMAFFPSTTNSTIGVSTISVIPTLPVNTSSIFTSSITSIGGTSSLAILGNASCSQTFTTVGDIDFLARDFFAQAQVGGVAKTTLAINSSGAGGNGLFVIGSDLGVGTLYASSITVSTNQMTLKTVPVPQQQYGRGTLAGGSATIVFSPPYADSNEYSVLATYKDTAGGAPLHANILSVSSFSVNGTGTNDFFYTTIGRV